MNANDNRVNHSWLAFGLRLGLSIVGFASTLTSFGQVTLHIDGQNWLWTTERSPAGSIIRPELGNGPNRLVLENPEWRKEFYHSMVSRLRFGNVVTEVAAAENERDFLLRAVVHNDAAGSPGPNLAGLPPGQTPKHIFVPSTDSHPPPPGNNHPWLKTSPVKMISEDNRESDHEITAEEYPAETRIVDLLPASRGLRGDHGFHRFREVRWMEATAYYPGPECTGKYAARGLTYTGKKAGYGLVAVDPRVVPLGSRLYIEGYGYAGAEDIGGAIKGNIIDLCFNSYQEAVHYGRRKVKVYILE